MEIKLTPLIIFLLLLLCLIFSIFIGTRLENFMTEYSKEGMTTYNNILSQIQKYNGMNPSPINITPVYDSFGNVIKNPILGGIYYDISGKIINFPKNVDVYDVSGIIVKKPTLGEMYYDMSGNTIKYLQSANVYNEFGNIITNPPTVGFMLDSMGNSIDLPIYDINNNVISNLSTYNGPVYDSYHNLIQFPYYDNSGNYMVSNIMTPDIYIKYISYLSSKNNTTNSNVYGDISGCSSSIDYENTSLDDYISNYYQHFWNQNQQMYSDDYILKTEIVPTGCPSWNSGIPPKINNKTTTKDVVTKDIVTKDIVTKDVVSDTYDATKDVVSNTYDATKGVVSNTYDATKDVVSDTYNATKNVVSDTYNATKNVVSDTYNAGASLVGGTYNTGSSLLNVNPTQIQNDNSIKYNKDKGLLGNYNGDNTISNLGYLKGTTQFTNASTIPNEVASFNNNYNAVPSKGGVDFRPLTTDFSKFGK